MSATFPLPLQTVIPGQLIASSLWNGEWQNLNTNFIPAGMDSYSTTDAQMQIQSNPFPGSITSHATSLGGEIERIRFQLAAILGSQYWYQAPQFSIIGAAAFLNPTGAIIVYAGIGAPTGYLACDGSAISRATYIALFNALGTTYGSGDGVSTFNLPNLIGRMVMGQATGLGHTGGSVSATLSDPGHNHTQNAHTHTDAGHDHPGGPHTHTLATITETVISNQTPNANTGSVYYADGDPTRQLNPTVSASGGSFPRKRTVSVDTTAASGNTGTGNASINANTASNNANTTGITPLVVPTLPPYIELFYFIKT